MITKNQPFYPLTLWYKPASTLRDLLAARRGHAAALLVAAVFGAVQSGRFYLASEDASAGFFLVGALCGLFGLYLFGWLLRNFGRWFGADAARRDLRTALGLGLLPWTLLFAALIPVLNASEDAATVAALYPIFFVGLIYGYVILLLSLSGALKVSVLKTFLCLVVTVLVSLFPLTLLAQLFVNMFGSAA